MKLWLARVTEKFTVRKAFGFLSHVSRVLLSGLLRLPISKFLVAQYRRSLYARRLLKWQKLDPAQYREFYDQIGGSLHVHPDVVELLGAMRGAEVDYWGFYARSVLVAALPLWPEGIVGSNSTLRDTGQRSLMDVGDGEVVLPIKYGYAEKIALPCSASMISSLHSDDIFGLSVCDMPQMLARGHVFGTTKISSATLSKRRNELGKFIKAGGSVHSVHDFSPEVLAGFYRSTFCLQRNRPPLGDKNLERVFARLSHLLVGHVLILDGAVAAIQVVFAVETPRGVLGIFVNGGVNPALRDDLAPGSVLGFINVRAMEQRALELGIPMRYCYGWGDHAYKNLICDPTPMFRC